MIYAKNNEESTIELFKKRAIYSYVQSKKGIPNVIRFDMEKFMYGRVNREFIPMIYNELSSRIELKQFPTTAGENKFAFNFVVDAFEDLRMEFIKAVAMRKISAQDEIFSDLKVRKAFENPYTRYTQHANDYMDTMIGHFRSNSEINIEGFEHFIELFLGQLKKTASLYPFTLAGFMKSRLCPISCTGLAIELADLDPSNDFDKMSKVISSKNYKFFANVCNSYGFMVDENVPWRIVADIGSAKMVSYAARYNLTSTDVIINTGYTPAAIAYFGQTFKLQLLRMYNAISKPYLRPIDACAHTGKTIMQEVVPYKFTPEQFLNKFDDSYFLDLYFKIRFMEDENNFEDYEQFLLSDDAQEVYNFSFNRPLGEALDKFERILNNPFDYRGSLTYTKETVRLNKEKSVFHEVTPEKLVPSVTSYVNGHAHNYQPTRDGYGETSYNKGHTHEISNGQIMPYCKEGQRTGTRKCHTHKAL